MPHSGMIPSPFDYRDYPVSSIVDAMELPASVRLDSKILSIRDQSVFGTCVGKSGAGIMSANYKEELSSIYIYSRCKEIDGIPHLEGTYPRTAMQIMQNYGTCTDKLLPYSEMRLPVPKMETIHHMEASSRKIKQYARANSLNDIKLALANGYLVMGCMLIGDNFMYNRGSEIIGKPSGNTYGYHAFKVCGYDDSKQAIRIANSWGKGWGENGYAWVSYDVLGSSMVWPEAWIVEVETKKSAEEIYPDRIFRELRRYLKKTLGGNAMFWEKESFYAALLAVIVPLLNYVFGWGIDIATIGLVLIPLLALIVGDKWESAKIAEAEARIKVAAINKGIFDVKNIVN